MSPHLTISFIINYHCPLISYCNRACLSDHPVVQQHHPRDRGLRAGLRRGHRGAARAPHAVAGGQRPVADSRREQTQRPRQGLQHSLRCESNVLSYILEVLYCILYLTNYLTRPRTICQKRRFTDLVNVVPLQISQRRWIWSVNTPSSSPSSLGSPCCSAPFSPCASPSSDGKSTYPDSRALRRSEIRRSICNE